MAFSETGSVLGPQEFDAYTIHNGAVYFVVLDQPASGTDSMVAVDLATGAQRWSQPLPEDAPADWGAPAAADTDAGPVVVVPAVVEEPGSGTTPGRELIRVFGIDGSTGSALWTTDIDDQDIADIAGYAELEVHVNQDHVAVSVRYLADGSAYTAYTALLDTQTGSLRWLEPEFLGQGLDDQIVVGNTETGGVLSPEYTLLGRSASDGAVRWRIEEPEGIRDIQSLGGGLGYFVGVPTDETITYLVSLESGEVLTSFDGGSACEYDGETVVCSTLDFFTFDDYVVAYDVQASEVLWELPDDAANRIAPSSLVDVRLGAVYAHTENGPIIMDARTGEDLVTDLPFMPDVIGPGYGLRTEGASLFVHPATG